LDRLMETFKWNNEDISFPEVLRPILTDEGLCYTFNALKTSDIYRGRYRFERFRIIVDMNVFGTFRSADYFTKWTMENGYNVILTRVGYSDPVLSMAFSQY
ncbi:hypothetical protein HA402_006874, partial [Bradysia odoriphaga]